MDSFRKKWNLHPRETANPLSLLFFTWVSKIFATDYKEKLTTENIWGPYKWHRSEHLGSKVEDLWNDQFHHKRKKGKTPKLMAVIFRAFKWDFLIAAFIQLVTQLMDVFVRPFLIAQIIDFFSTEGGELTTVLELVAGFLLMNFGMTLLFNHYMLITGVLGMKIRVAIVSLVFRKCLGMSRRAMIEISPGQAVNLVSNDVSRFELFTLTMHTLWSAPMQTIIIAYLLFDTVGYASLGGLAVIAFVAPLQSYLAKLTSKFRRKIAQKTDERIRQTDEVLGGIHVIKMFAWEKYFVKMLALARKAELKFVMLANMVRGIYMSFNLCTTRIALFCTVCAYVLSGYSLTSTKLYVILIYYSILSQSLASIFVRAVAELAECLVSVKRLENFILNDYVEPLPNASDNQPEIKQELAVIAKNLHASWDPASTTPTLQDLSFQVRTGHVIGVIGSVGSGKSSLLELLLGEMRVQGGSINVNGNLSYACQESWVFTGSIRENILLGLPYNRSRYREVINACCLRRDLELFPDGDQTAVGERGASLSGGQKARINLARAVYKEADIYLLDDPLSAVDTHVANALFHYCIKGFLRGKTVVIATHQLQFLEMVDRIIYLQNGKIQDMGSFKDFMKHGHDITKIVEQTLSTKKNDEEGGEKQNQKSISRMVSRQSISSLAGEEVVHNAASNADDTHIHETEPEKTEDLYTNYDKSVILGYLKAGNTTLLFGFFVVFLVIAQVFASASDYWVAQWTKQQDSDIASAGTEEFVSPRTITGLIILGVFVAVLVIAAFTRSILFYTSCLRCSKGLHYSMVRTVLSTDLSYFNNNPSGAIITTAIVNPWLLGPIVAFVGITGTIRHFYMKTSKNVKRLENLSRAPVYTQLNTCLQGLTTIRAHGSQKYLTQAFDFHQDLNTTCYYTYLTAQQGYAYCLDIVNSLYLMTVLGICISLRDVIAGSEIGLIISQTMVTVFFLQWGMRQSSELVNLMTSVERLLGFLQLPVEEKHPETKLSPGNNWPSLGEIEFKNVFLTYNVGQEPAIKNLNLKINAGTKIGIVGRTGAGKSSMAGSLLRLAIVDGQVLIDGIDTSKVTLNTLRSRIAVIPQNPVLFSGNLRSNLDPFNEYPDYIIWNALKEMDLSDIMKGQGLNTRISDGGSNLSIGERQMICLGRAIVRNSKIIIMDEATASVDLETDSLIQNTIRTKFNHCTVLTIAHRLNTIIDSDVVLVMEAGCAVETGHPYLLLQKQDSYFSKLVEETGPIMSAHLKLKAKNDYMKKAASILPKNEMH